jgi:hypothetical protein
MTEQARPDPEMDYEQRDRMLGIAFGTEQARETPEPLTPEEWADVVDVYGSFGSRLVADRLEAALRAATPDPAEPTNPDLACICEACRTTEERP